MSLLLFELLTPWIVMAAVAAVAFASGLPDYAVIIVALACALGVTFAIREFERKRRRVAAK